MIEKFIESKFIKFLSKNKLLSEKQFGFRKDTSTENALCTVTEHIVCALNKEIKVTGIFSDLAKTFDTVSHQITYERLNQIEIWGMENNIIKTYLVDSSSSR